MYLRYLFICVIICFLTFIQVQRLVKSEILMVNIGSTSTGGRILAVKSDLAKIVLTTPVCTQEGEKIALSRRVEKHWRYVNLYVLYIQVYAVSVHLLSIRVSIYPNMYVCMGAFIGLRSLLHIIE